MKKNVLIVGGRRMSKLLAISLIKKGYQVTTINDTYEDCIKLAEIENLTAIFGDGTKPYVLDDASASDADIAIALTSKDEENLVICELCKKRFHVRKTLALVSDPKNMDFFYQMGIDRVICAISAVTGIIQQQAFVQEMANIVPIGKGRIHVAEVPISVNAPAADKKVWEIELPNEVIIGCILRGDETIIPRGDTRISVGDMLVLLSGNGQEIAAIKELTGK